MEKVQRSLQRADDEGTFSQAEVEERFAEWLR